MSAKVCRVGCMWSTVQARHLVHVLTVTTYVPIVVSRQILQQVSTLYTLKSTRQRFSSGTLRLMVLHQQIRPYPRPIGFDYEVEQQKNAVRQH